MIEATVDELTPIIGTRPACRALRFHRPGLRFFEVDQASTQAAKRYRVDRLGLAFQPVDYVACDLTRGDLVGALAAAGHAAGQPTLFVCEGLLLYLDPPVAEGLLHALHSCAAPGSRLGLSAHELPVGARATVKLRTAAQRLLPAAIREPRRSFYGPGELTALLERAGWRVVGRQTRHNASTGQTGMLLLAEP
jgi:methyltransferase (TIGR00027 family)